MIHYRTTHSGRRKHKVRNYDSKPVILGQTKRISLLESVTNILIGFGVAIVANAVVLPWFGFVVNFRQSFDIAVIFTIISIVRSYGVRRLYNLAHLRGWFR